MCLVLPTWLILVTYIWHIHAHTSPIITPVKMLHVWNVMAIFVSGSTFSNDTMIQMLTICHNIDLGHDDVRLMPATMVYWQQWCHESGTYAMIPVLAVTESWNKSGHHLITAECVTYVEYWHDVSGVTKTIASVSKPCCQYQCHGIIASNKLNRKSHLLVTAYLILICDLCRQSLWCMYHLSALQNWCNSILANIRIIASTLTEKCC